MSHSRHPISSHHELSTASSIESHLSHTSSLVQGQQFNKMLPQMQSQAHPLINPHLQGLSHSQATSLSQSQSSSPVPQTLQGQQHSHLYVRAEGQSFAQRESFL